MSSTPHDGRSSAPPPTSGPAVEDDVESVAPETLEEQLELVATRSPI